MTRNTSFIAIIAAAFVCVLGTQVAAEPQKMQTMTTVGSPASVQLAQANTTNIATPANLAPASNTASPASSTQPANVSGDQDYVFVVNAVQRDVKIAPIGAEAWSKEWKPVQIGDRIRQGYQLRTGIQSGVKLVGVPADPPTVMSIEGSTLIAFDEMIVQNNSRQHLRMSLAAGAIKAGVAESGDVRSDMEIRMPTGTLSKKGTDIFRLEYQNGRFRMSLSQQGRGLLQAIQYRFGSTGNVIGSRSRFVTRGQFVTQEMFKAIDHVKFDRDVNVNDLIGQTPNELLTLLNNRGLAFTLPWGGNLANILGSPTMQPTDGDLGGMNGLTGTRIGSVRRRGEGDFGVGQTVLPGNPLFGANNRRIGESRQITHRDGKQMVRRTGARRVMNR